MIEIEVAPKSSSPILITLFREHNFIDQSAALQIGWRNPGNVDAADLALQALQQRHEVPDRKDMVFHEDLDGGQAINLVIQSMIQQSLPMR